MSEILQDFAIDNTIWNEEPEIIKKLKHIIFNVLEEHERNMILYYAQSQSQRTLAKALGCSVATVCLTIKDIRAKIKEYLSNPPSKEITMEDKVKEIQKEKKKARQQRYLEKINKVK